MNIFRSIPRVFQPVASIKHFSNPAPTIFGRNIRPLSRASHLFTKNKVSAQQSKMLAPIALQPLESRKDHYTRKLCEAIQSAPCGQQLLNTCNKEKFIHLLSSIYGSSVVDKIVFQGDNHSRFYNKFSNKLTDKDKLHWLVAVRHHLNLEDLDQEFYNFKQRHPCAALEHLNPMDFSPVYSVRDLPAYQLRKLIQAFCNPKAAAVLIEKGKKSKDIRLGLYDHLFNESMKNTSLKSAVDPFRELEAKASYSLPESLKNGMIIEVMSEQKEKQLYVLKAQIHKDGVHLLFWTPLHGKGPLHIQCRGTNGVNSVQRDLDPTGVGKTAFDNCEQNILAILQASGCKHFEVTGHSLGGADVQRMLVLLATWKALKNLVIKKVNAYAWCAPKLDQETIDQWNRNLQVDPQIRQNFSISYYAHENDLVPMCGEKALKGLNFRVTRVRNPKTGLKEAHTKNFYNNGKIREEYFRQSSSSTQFNRLERAQRRNYSQISNYLQDKEGFTLVSPQLPQHTRRIECTDEQIKRHKKLQKEFATGIHNNKRLNSSVFRPAQYGLYNLVGAVNRAARYFM